MMSDPKPIKEGPQKSSKGWKRLPPDRIDQPNPIIKEAKILPSEQD
jgi:hypothetical protein